MLACASALLLSLAAIASAAPAPAKRDISYGATLGPFPLIINTWYNGHSQDYRTTNLTLDPNQHDSHGYRVLDAYPVRAVIRPRPRVSGRLVCIAGLTLDAWRPARCACPTPCADESVCR